MWFIIDDYGLALVSHSEGDKVIRSDPTAIFNVTDIMYPSFIRSALLPFLQFTHCSSDHLGNLVSVCDCHLYCQK